MKRNSSVPETRTEPWAPNPQCIGDRRELQTTEPSAICRRDNGPLQCVNTSTLNNLVITSVSICELPSMSHITERNTFAMMFVNLEDDMSTTSQKNLFPLTWQNTFVEGAEGETDIENDEIWNPAIIC